MAEKANMERKNYITVALLIGGIVPVLLGGQTPLSPYVFDWHMPCTFLHPPFAWNRVYEL